MLLCTHLTVNTTEAFYIFYEVIMILLNYVKKYMQTQYATPQWGAYSTS